MQNTYNNVFFAEFDKSKGVYLDIGVSWWEPIIEVDFYFRFRFVGFDVLCSGSCCCMCSLGGIGFMVHVRIRCHNGGIF